MGVGREALAAPQAENTVKALDFEGATRRLGAPKDWNYEKDGICWGLDVIDHDGYMVSLWQPSPAELELLNQGKPVQLWVMGTGHPPVNLQVVE